MGKFIRHEPCDECGSSDAKGVYEDGTGYCFSCETFFKAGDEEEKTVETEFETVKSTDALHEIATYDTRGFRERGITKKVAEFFNCKVSYSSSGEIDAHFYPYYDEQNRISGYKVRNLPKDFRVTGKIESLFGKSQFRHGGKRLVITEGELDAMAVAQAYMDKYREIYPVISIPTGAKSSKKFVLAERDWIRSFEEVILMFDQDEVGQEGQEMIAKIIGADKVKVTEFRQKDACDLYMEEGASGVNKVIWSAVQWSPAGIVSSAQTWDLYKQELDAEYIPWPEFAVELNKMSYGRRMGSITMITSGTGMGKSSFLKEDQYHLLNTTDAKIGVCSLEESIYEAVGGIMSLHANKRLQLPDVEISEDEERKLWEETMGSDRMMFLDHQGSVTDDSLIDKIEFMALAGCKFIYLDHITIAVSEAGGDDVNKATDKLMSDLLKLVKRHNVWLGVVSHLRKTNNNQKSFEEGAVPSDDDLKGSGSLKQIAMQIIAISRNKTEEDAVKRQTGRVWVLKDRFTGRTGPAGAYRFIESTGRLVHAESAMEMELENLSL